MSSPPLNLTSTEPNADLKIACVYALSGQYGTLPRWLYYLTLVLAIFGRNQEWVVIGALVSSLAYAGTTAIHVMALVTSRKRIFDLDILGAWAILSTAALSYVAIIHWSSTVRNSKARIVMVVWGVLVGLGLVFTRVLLYDSVYDDYEPACYSADGIMLTSPLQLITTEFNCTYSCFQFTKPMRGMDEIVAVPKFIVDNGYFRLSLILIGPVMFAAHTAITYDSQQHTPSQLCTRLVMKYLNPQYGEDLVKVVWNASNESWYGGYFVLFHFIRRSPWSRRKVILSYVAYPWILLGLLMDFLCIPFLVLNIVLNELHILRSGIPTNESMYNVGQWGPWVNSALVVIAAVINKLMEVREERKNKKKNTTFVAQPELRRMSTDGTLVEEVHMGSSIGSSMGSKELARHPSSVYRGRSRNNDSRETRII